MTFVWDEFDNILFVDSVSNSGYYPGTIPHSARVWRMTMSHYHIMGRVLKDGGVTFSSVRLRR